MATRYQLDHGDLLYELCVTTQGKGMNRYHPCPMGYTERLYRVSNTQMSIRNPNTAPTNDPPTPKTLPASAAELAVCDAGPEEENGDESPPVAVAVPLEADPDSAVGNARPGTSVVAALAPDDATEPPASPLFCADAEALLTLYDAPVCVTDTAATVCWSMPATLAEDVGAASAVPVPETMTPAVLAAVVAPEAPEEPEAEEEEEELAATPLETVLMLCHVPDWSEYWYESAGL